MESLFIILPIMFLLGCVWIRFQPKFRVSMPVAALLVVLIGSVFGREFFAIESGPIPLTLDRVMLVGLFAFFGISFLKGTEDVRPFNLLDVLALVWIALITFSTLTHDWRFLGNMPASRLLFFNLMPLAVYWLARNSNASRSDLKTIAVFLSVFAIYLAATAIAEVNELTSLVFPTYIMSSETQEFLGRGRGPFLNPVSNGMFIVAGFCCLLMWWPKASTSMRLVITGCLLLMTIGVYYTMTRSVWLGLIVAGSLLIWLPASRQLKGAMLILATLISIVAFPVISEKIFSFKRDREVTQEEMEISAQMRPMFAIVAWKMFQDRPFFGVGFGQYAQTKDPYLRDPHTGKPLAITSSLYQHNVFLAYLTETGLTGLFCLCALLLATFKVNLNTWRNKSLDIWASRFGLFGIVMLVNYCINGMFHDVSIIPQGHMLMFFLMGMVNNIYSKPDAFTVQTATDSTTHEKQPLSNEAYGLPAFNPPKYSGS